MEKDASIGDHIRYLVRYQGLRYESMGNYKYYAAIVLTSLIVLGPHFFQTLWVPFQDILPRTIQLYLAANLIVTMVFASLYTLCMYFIYTQKIPFFQQFRAQPGLRWHWQGDQKQWETLLWKTVKVSTFNILVVISLISIPDAYIIDKISLKIAQMPSPWTIGWQLQFFTLVEQILFYCFHRMLHHPSLYFLHKQHHEYKATMAMTFSYSSPIQYALNVTALKAGYMILSNFCTVHIFTILLWFILGLSHTMDAHSGYEWPWSLTILMPFSSGGRYHAFHHSKNVGNFGGSNYLLDFMMGTNKEYFSVLQKQWKSKQIKSE